jgi:DNA-binding beta-propeller fold protein YncE
MRIRGLWLAFLATAVLSLAASAAPAQASRALLNESLLRTVSAPPPPDGQIEGACGLAVVPGGGLFYLSDYYHRTVDLFSATGVFQSQIALPGANPLFGSVDHDAVCGLAFSSGVLYANEFHQGVLRLRPNEAAIDGGQSTGVAVDAAGNLYVDDRTRIVEYAAPVDPGDSPVAVFGNGSLGDGFGLAVSPSGARIYAADADGDTVKVYEPATSASTPAQTITGFNSLRDAALAVDPSNGHLLVVDNTQPGFKHPKAVVEEFDAAGVPLGALPGFPIHGEPSGIAVDPSSGGLYVTSGNDEGATVFAYGAYNAAPEPTSLLAPQAGPGQPQLTPPSPAAFPAAGSSSRAPRGDRTVASASEIFQRGGVRVKLNGDLTPSSLPRRGAAGVHVSLAADIASTHGDTPPQLRRISIAINRNGHFDPRGLPACRLDQIQPSSNDGALAACGAALVGQGSFSADVKLPEQTPFPSRGKVLAFNGRYHGKPAIFAHVFGTDPVPTSFTLPFTIGSTGGTYGTVLRATVPDVTGGSITGLRLDLGRNFRSAGKRHTYISAGCPAPAGFPGAVFPFVRTVFAFSGGPKLTSVITRTCKVR